MSELAIRVDGIGKRYRIGASVERTDSLRETITEVAKSPLRNLQRLRGLSSFAEEQADDVIWALRDITFQVRRGEALGIVGRNGAGKSTLLKILSRITNPTTGRAVVDGRVGALLEVGTGFHQELTGRENVYLNGSILGMDRGYIDRMFDEIVDFAGVRRFVDTPVKRYSSGMKVRLAFAVAAHLEPDILVIDEVLAVGDAEFQRKCLGKMDQAAGEGRTVLFVSHDMDAITRLCDRAILIDGGKLVAEGAAAEIVHTYLNGAIGVDGSASWSGQDGEGEGVELRSVQVLNPAGKASSTVTVEDELRVELTYAVDRPGLKFRCGVNVFTQGTCAFSTFERTETERAHRGLYRSTVVIPAHLLAEGHYSMNVVIVATRGGKIGHVNKKSVVAIQVRDPLRGDSARGDYGGNVEGVVRPRLEWRIEAAGSQRGVSDQVAEVG